MIIPFQKCTAANIEILSVCADLYIVFGDRKGISAETCAVDVSAGQESRMQQG
jgi:hypothetical protein